jgi:hypothetical protein
MNAMSETKTEAKVLTPEAYKLHVARMPDGRSLEKLFTWPKLAERDGQGNVVKENDRVKVTGTSLFWDNLRKLSVAVGQALTKDQYLEITGIDTSAPAELVECAVCVEEQKQGKKDKSESVMFTPIRIALFDKEGKVVKKDGKSIIAGSFVRFLNGGAWELVGACGSPFNNRSHLSELRNLRGGEKPDLAMTYEDGMAAIKRSQAKHEGNKSLMGGLRERFLGKREHREELPGLGAQLGVKGKGERPQRKQRTQ